jgi:hypothetical protein
MRLRRVRLVVSCGDGERAPSSTRRPHSSELFAKFKSNARASPDTFRKVIAWASSMGVRELPKLQFDVGCFVNRSKEAAPRRCRWALRRSDARGDSGDPDPVVVIARKRHVTADFADSRRCVGSRATSAGREAAATRLRRVRWS